MSNYIINISDGQRYSTPVVNRFSSNFDRIRFILDLSRDLSSYSFGIVAAMCGECFMITEDGEKLTKGTEETTDRITLDWSVGTEITAKDGVVIYQIIAFSADSEGNMKNIWYSPEGRVTVGESIELTEYETAEIGSRPSIVMQLLAKVSSYELNFNELRDADSTHKTEVILDHPDGSVVKAKLSADVIKILDEAVSKTHFENIVSPLCDDVAMLDENVQILDRRTTETEENISANETAISENTKKLEANIIRTSSAGKKIYLKDSAQDSLNRFNIYGHTTQISTTGKNMIPYPYYETNSKTENGITFTVNSDGSITLNGTATTDAIYTMYNNYSQGNTNLLILDKSYTLSGSTEGGAAKFIVQAAIRLRKEDGDYDIKYLQVTNSPITYTIPNSYTGAYFFNIQIRVYAGYTANNVTIYPMFEKNKEASPYEPYTKCLYSPSPEYPQPMKTIAINGDIKLDVNGETASDVQSFSLSTPNGLPGVPVLSDGNYTDENGQMWVCDEIDLARGVYIQRIGSSTLPSFSNVYMYTGTDDGDVYEGFTGCAFPCTDIGALCEKAKYVVNWSDNRATEIMLSPTIGVDGWCDLMVQCIATDEEDFRSKLQEAKIMYIMSSPKEKALSDEEIATFNNLQTYKPTTNIFNDADAYMAISYVADPKNYIDSKFAALEAAVISAGGGING